MKSFISILAYQILLNSTLKNTQSSRLLSVFELIKLNAISESECCVRLRRANNGLSVDLFLVL